MDDCDGAIDFSSDEKVGAEGNVRKMRLERFDHER